MTYKTKSTAAFEILLLFIAIPYFFFKNNAIYQRKTIDLTANPGREKKKS